MLCFTHIIDNYGYSFPVYIVFIHGLAQSWHQEDDTTSFIRSLRISLSKQLAIAHFDVENISAELQY